MSTVYGAEAMETILCRLCAEKALIDSEGRTHGATGDAWLAVMQDDGSWADVSYQDDHLKDWAAAQHLMRLQTIARGWALAGSRDDAVLAAILRGLDNWYARNPQNPNWWWNQIGAPLLLGETLLRVKGRCDRSYFERAVPAFTCHEPIARFTGQNLVWTATVRIYHGLLLDEPSLVKEGFELIGKEVRIFPGEEGIQPDMSFFQHGPLLYSGGYGQGFAGDVSRLMALAAGTEFAFSVPVVDRFARFLLDGSRWMVRGHTFDPGAIGREISRQGHSAERFFAGLRNLAAFSHSQQAEAQASAAIDTASGRSLVTGNRHFWCADLMTQHRLGYYLSIRMPSARVVNADWACCGGEGRLCHHIAEGMTVIMRDGDEYRDIYPVWNWRQLPGATVVQETGEFEPDTLRGEGEPHFAGGASDGSVGCAAMDFTRAGLSARKAWFLFDDGMVALGAGVTASADVPVRTTINQCHWRGSAFRTGDAAPLTAGDHCLAPGMAWWHDGVTYRILSGTGTLRLGAQSGAWSDCGVGSTEVQTLPVMNAGFDHGVKPANATYAYAVLPGIDATAAFADDPARFVVLQNTPELQAVWHAGEARGHAVFYQPGAVTFPDGRQIACDISCILLYHPHADGTLTLTVADPTQQARTVTISLTGRTNMQLGITLPPGEYAGASQTITLRWD